MGKIKAELLKYKGTAVLWIHLGLPLTGAVIFILYGMNSAISRAELIYFYAETLSIVFPAAAAIVCALAAEQEREAGNLQNLLLVPGLRCKGAAVKYFVLVLLGLVSCVIAVGVFGIAFPLSEGGSLESVIFYLKLTGILWSSQLFLYLLDLFLAVRFTEGVCIGAGVTCSVLAALLMTGLGDMIWPVSPWSWGGHFASFLIQYQTGQIGSELMEILWVWIRVGIGAEVIFLLTGSILGVLWFGRFEGSSMED